MSTTTQSTRTKTEVENDIAYCVRLGERHARLYRRVRTGLTFVALCGSASAFANLFANQPALTIVGGLLVAIAGAIDVACDFATSAVLHSQQGDRMQELSAKSASLSVDRLDAAYRSLLVGKPQEIEALRAPTFNDVMRSRGYDAWVRPLTTFEGVIDRVA